jgi:hypothetical protein
LPFLFLNRSTAASTPSLLNPMRLIKPLSSGKRNKRGLSFPGWALGVSVPISIKPKPNAESSSNIFASLSKPAASPTGFGNFIPKTSRSSFGFFTA